MITSPDTVGGARRPPRTAVITITHDRDAHLHRQRSGLAAAAPDLHVIVGMGETPRLRPIDGAPPTVTTRLETSPLGLPLAAARNRGADLALRHGAELLVFLDVDCIPGAGLLRGYQRARAALAGREALLCGPVAYLPPAPPGGYPEHGLELLATPHPARPAPPDGEIRLNDRFELFWSLSFAVDSRTWSELGGFCVDFVGYGAEDTDFAHRAARRGAVLAWVGGALAHHQHHPPARDCPARQREMIRNANVFHDRHGWFPMRDWLVELERDGVAEFRPDDGLLRWRRPG